MTPFWKDIIWKKYSQIFGRLNIFEHIALKKKSFIFANKL